MGSELFELRDYRSGDPPKSIAWKVSAKRDRLITRQNESEVPVRTTLFIDGSASTRTGPHGDRPLDKITYAAATIARSSLSARDPVGLVLFDDGAYRPIRPQGGQRHYYRLLEELSRWAAKPRQEVRSRMPDDFIDQLWSHCNNRYPELLEPHLNQIPFFFFPLFPQARFRKRQRMRLANVIGYRFRLSTDQTVQLMYDSKRFAWYGRELLREAEHVVPNSAHRTSDRADVMIAGGKIQVLTDALLKAVARGRDNEVFVIFLEVLQERSELTPLMRAIRIAVARHHRVIAIGPWPVRRTANASDLWLDVERPRAADVESLVRHADEIRLRDAERKWRHAFLEAGASIGLLDDPQSIQIVLAEADYVKSGRTAAGPRMAGRSR